MYEKVASEERCLLIPDLLDGIPRAKQEQYREREWLYRRCRRSEPRAIRRREAECRDTELLKGNMNEIFGTTAKFRSGCGPLQGVQWGFSSTICRSKPRSKA
jgi:hypothetical protein